MPHDVVIALGSNIRPEHYVPEAIARLEGLLKSPRQAAIYQTPAIGHSEAPAFWNTAVRGTTVFGPRTLKAALRRIEEDLDRRRTGNRYAPRTIDLDEIWRDKRVTDPDVATRPFLQQCLRDVGIRLPPNPTLQTP